MTSQAESATKDFLAKAGRNDTTVHESVNPAVLHESILPTQHENVTTVIDKEIHQDHYHTSVQPITDKQILPEQHTHNLVGVEHRHFEHGNKEEVAQRLATEASQFKDERVHGDTKHTHSVQPTLQGEHIHHHVHELIQPVVQRETIQPTVVHTTVPIHETHHNAAQHHMTSALPALSMADFKKQGGVLTGREERYDGFEGEPRSVGGTLGGHSSSHSHGTHDEKLGSSGLTGTHGTHSSTTGSTGLTGSDEKNASTLHGTHTSDTTVSPNTTGNRDTKDTSNMSTAQKIMAKLDPRVDSNGDGKAGVGS